MLNYLALNTETLDSVTAPSVISGAGTLVSFDQRVISSTSGAIIRFEQIVGLLHQGGGTVVQFNQSIKAAGAGSIISISQNVKNTIPTFLLRNGYDCEIYIDSIEIPKSQICSEIRIKKSEGVASTLTFTIKPPLGIQDPGSYQGLPVFVNIINSSGQSVRDFTGYIDNPTIDLISQKISFSCTDRRESRILALPSSYVSNIGQYSIDVFGDPKDQADELNKRLSTVPMSFDFDNSGNPQVTPWAPKSIAHFTLNNSTIYYEKPDVTYTNRTKTLNTVNITVNYRHQRLHQQIANVTWSGYNDFLNDWFNQGTPTFPQRTTITSAASSTSWVPLTRITFIPLWPAGGFGSVEWQPNQVTNNYINKTINSQLLYYPADYPRTPSTPIFPDGFEHFAQINVLDTNGNPVKVLGSQTVTDTSSVLCRGAQWIAGKKFAQNINELYTIKITSPQAISRYGAIESHENVNINDPYNTSVWTSDKTMYNAAATSGTAINCTTNGNGFQKGETSIHLANVGTGKFFVGDQITITGDLSGQYYTVAEDLTLPGGTLKLLPPGLGAILQPGVTAVNLVPGSPTDAANFFIDQKPLYPHLIAALNCVCSKGQVELLKAHRDVTVNFRTKIWPEIDIIHTVQTTATWVACKGKVSSIEHLINCETGEAYTDVSLKLSRSLASDPQSPLVFKTPPYEDISYIGLPQQVALQTHVGINPAFSVNPAAVTWNGYIGNSTVRSNATTSVRTKFPESFTVDYPPIPTPLTVDRTITQNPPGTNNGVRTDAAGYLQGASTINLASGGTGQLLQGDTITIAGDSSLQTYVVQQDILDVSSGGILTIAPGLGAALNMSNHNITSSSPGNQFTVHIPNDPLTVTFS